jgi:hypothetical protein
VNRRDFIRGFGLASGGLVATATMAEAGMLAEFMSWLKRAPVWSFPSPDKLLAVPTSPLWNEIDAVTIDSIRENTIFDSLFTTSPIIQTMRVTKQFDGVPFIQEPFVYEA